MTFLPLCFYNHVVFLVKSGPDLYRYNFWFLEYLHPVISHPSLGGEGLLTIPVRRRGSI